MVYSWQKGTRNSQSNTIRLWLEDSVKNAKISGYFGFVFEENSSSKVTWLSWRPFLNCFPFTRKRETSVFKYLWFEERFRKALFSWRICVDCGPSCINKAAFSNFSVVVWTCSLRSLRRKWLKFKKRNMQCNHANPVNNGPHKSGRYTKGVIRGSRIQRGSLNKIM